MNKFSITIGGGISECWDVLFRKSPGAAINAWFNALPKRPLDVWIENDLDWEPDIEAYRFFWDWVDNHPEKVMESESKAYARGKYHYSYRAISNAAIEKAKKVRGMSDDELLKEYNWSGYGPFTGG